jgi:carboxypeptidase Taq
MTTRFKENDITEGLTGAIHETGHSLYEQNRNSTEEFKDLPVSSAMSMGVHESQSLLWERMVALSKPFQSYLLPKIQETFPEVTSLQGKTPEQMYGAMNIMRDPSTIRVEADEVTYSLHVILRYEIEKDLINGHIQVQDVPKIWNEKMKEYLGVDITDDAKGCLQDVHWAAGAMGYFPTYSLGAIYACQIFEAAQADLEGLDDDIAAGRFTRLKEWLRVKVHESGSYHPSGDELMVAVTGKALDPQIFLRYLRNKYTEIYSL